MEFTKGNVMITVEKIPGFGKRPGLWIGTKKPNAMMKMASFGRDEKAEQFCKWLTYWLGVTDKEPSWWEEEEE